MSDAGAGFAVGTISSQAVRGGAYLAARYGLGVLVSVGNMLVMTWWIGPHAYGLFVTAIGLAAFVASLARGGVDTYLVRSGPEPDARIYGTAVTFVLAASVGLGLASAAAIPLLVRWFGSREFVLPYLVLLLTIPITALTGVPTAKLERALDFRSVAGIELAAQAAGLLVAALLAWSHSGIWAPVIGQIVWQASTLVGVWTRASIPVRLSFEPVEARKMLTFGTGLTASLRTWQLRTLVNPLLVGKFVGAEGVAFVALAIRIAESLGTFRLAAGRMAIATLARLQDKHDEFRSTLERVLFLQVITLGPLLCGFALLGPLLLKHAIGARWLPSLDVYPFVAAGVLVNSVYNLQASGLFVMGRQWTVMKSYTAHVVLLAVGTLVLLPRVGIAAYGWAELLACSAYLLIHSSLARTVTVSYRRLAPSVAGFLVGLFLIPASHALLSMN